MAKKATGLRKARALITDPAKWTQQTGSRNSAGKWVPARSRRAVSFCALGAIERFREETGYFYLREAADLLGEGAGRVAVFNDSHKHDDVLWMFDLAISFQEVGE